MRFADEITLARDEAFDVLQILNLAVSALDEAGLVVEAVQAQELIELIEDRLTPGE
jgi:hypothetical protein